MYVDNAMVAVLGLMGLVSLLNWGSILIATKTTTTTTTQYTYNTATALLGGTSSRRSCKRKWNKLNGKVKVASVLVSISLLIGIICAIASSTAGSPQPNEPFTNSIASSNFATTIPNGFRFFVETSNNTKISSVITGTTFNFKLYSPSWKTFTYVPSSDDDGGYDNDGSDDDDDGDDDEGDLDDLPDLEEAN